MPDFAQHFLHENHGSQRPARLLFYDCETTTESHSDYSLLRMYLGWSYYVRRDLSRDLTGGEWVNHTTQNGICAYIESKTVDKGVLYVIGHNIFFDLQASGFFRYFTKAGWKLEFYYDKGLTYVLIIRKGSRRIKAISSTNYFSESLERLGNSIGLPKLGISFAEASPEETSVYCKRDVEIVIASIASWLRFIDEHDCGSFGLTRASQSFRAYRHRFMEQIPAVHQDQIVQALERRCYTGGRTEAFRIGEISDSPVCCYDINSMYPFVMMDNEYPYQLIDYKTEPTIENVIENLKLFAVCAECEIETDEPAYSYRLNGKVVFPIGRLKLNLTTPGLLYAIEHGHLKRVTEASYYKKAKLFTKYIDYFYSIKEQFKREGNTVGLAMVKIFLNSLYGKFGQRYEVTEYEPCYDGPEYLRIESYEESTGRTVTETYLMNCRVTTEGDRAGDDSFTAIAAHVTEYARFHLWSIIKSIGVGRVLYTDTDSVYLHESDAHLIKHPIDQYKLGALSLDGRFKRMIIYGAKDYELDGKLKCKGIPKSATGDEHEGYHYTEFLGQSSHLRAGVDDAFIIRPITKRPKRAYDKGIVASDGRVSPLIISDW